MAAPEQPFDLKQVAKLFNDAIATIRDSALSIEALEPQAIEWLKEARYRLMRNIEKKYYELERSRHEPLSQPDWAVDPSKYLYLSTSDLPGVLEPYRVAFGENLHQLLKDCGFQHSSLNQPSFIRSISFTIYFPLQVPAARHEDHPRTLQVEDEFSLPPSGGHSPRRGAIFAATDFGRLLASVREDNGGADSKARKETEGNGNTNADEESEVKGEEGANPGADKPETAKSPQVAAPVGTVVTPESDPVVILRTLVAILVAVQRRD